MEDFQVQHLLSQPEPLSRSSRALPPPPWNGFQWPQQPQVHPPYPHGSPQPQSPFPGAPPPYSPFQPQPQGLPGTQGQPAPAQQLQGAQQGNGTDKIERVEAEPTQVIIYTTKDGPADRLRIRIEMTDLQDHRVLAPIDLQGLWLIISRGRYTIPFLKPDRWYGLHFRSENIIGNRPVVHVDERLIKTASRPPPPGMAPPPGPQQNSSELFEVLMHRSLEGQENLEGFYVTARWLTKDRINNSEILVDVEVECASSSTHETIHLPSTDDGVTIEINMDHQYRIENLNKKTHQVKAHIQPLKCKKVCWTKSLQLKSGQNTFNRPYGEECKEIGSTTSVTFLRNLKHYTVEADDLNMDLVVDTELGESNEDAFVTLKATRLDGGNEDEMTSQTFSTHNSNGTFRLSVEPEAVLAVQYEYTKVKPFHYIEKENFLVETPGFNGSSTKNQPVVLKFQPETLSVNMFKNSTPTIILTRSDKMLHHDVDIRLEPFCQQPATRIRLSSNHPRHEIDVSQLFCSQTSENSPKLPFCEDHVNYTHCANSILCYGHVIKLQTEDYASDVRCLNVSQHFVMTSSSLYPFHVVCSLLLLFTTLHS